MSRSVFGIAAVFIVLFSPVSGVIAQDASLYDQLLPEYETIRLALLNDSVEGVGEASLAMVRHLDRYDPGSDTPPAAVKPENTEKFMNMMRDLRASADKLGQEESLAASRDAFAELSRALVAYRQMAANPTVVVAFCPMAEKIWLQPKGEIGNPYYGQSMAGCGEIISE